MPEDIEGNRFAFATHVRKRANELAAGAEPDVFPIVGENIVSTAMRDIRYRIACREEDASGTLDS